MRHLSLLLITRAVDATARPSKRLANLTLSNPFYYTNELSVGIVLPGRVRPTTGVLWAWLYYTDIAQPVQATASSLYSRSVLLPLARRASQEKHDQGLWGVQRLKFCSFAVVILVRGMRAVCH